MMTLNSTPRSGSANEVLAGLGAGDFSLLQPHLNVVELRVPRQLEHPNKRIDHVYFIDSGFASVVANGSTRPMEIGMIGREGMTGLAVLMGRDRTPNETYMQLAGGGRRIAVPHLLGAIRQSATLHQSFLRYGHAFHIQTTQTTVTNARCTVEQRLARWLLMAHDRIDGDQMFITHEFLSLMLGVRRASITDTLRILVEDDLIAIKRGTIAILDRVRLQKSSKGAYIPPPPKKSD
jgi:CRP-like cAMP-binding protein